MKREDVEGESALPKDDSDSRFLGLDMIPPADTIKLKEKRCASRWKGMITLEGQEEGRGGNGRAHLGCLIPFPGFVGS